MEHDTVETANIGGKRIFLVDVRWPGSNPEKPIIPPVESRLGLLVQDLGENVKRGQLSMVAQFYKLVVPGIILAKHIFRGLKRPLYCDGDMGGDKIKVIFSWKPVFDYEWAGGANGKPVDRPAPVGKTFVVIVTPNDRHKQSFPNIVGWIDHWNWVDEDQGLPGAPVGWVDRYESKIYTEGQTERQKRGRK